MEITYQNSAHLKKHGYFDLLFTFFVEKTNLTYIRHYVHVFAKLTNLSCMVSLGYCVDSYSRHFVGIIKQHNGEQKVGMSTTDIYLHLPKENSHLLYLYYSIDILIMLIVILNMTVLCC